MLIRVSSHGLGGGAVRMPESIPAREGYASFHGFKSRYRVVGEHCAHWPLLCIHGGPGFGHDYLRPIGEMATTGRQVVFYDQLGCDGHGSPPVSVEWSLELFLEEVQAVREAAGLTRCHVLGHGWGGILALAYALTAPAGLESLVLSSAVASVPQWHAEIARLVAELPGDVRASLRPQSDSAEHGSRDSLCAVDDFLRRHLCRMKPWPAVLDRCLRSGRARPEARNAMLGKDELAPAGLLADWDVVARLGEITCPTLVVSGRHDLVTPLMAATLYQGIPRSEWVVFEYSAHVPHLEEPQRYLEVLDGFLGKVEGEASHRA